MHRAAPRVGSTSGEPTSSRADAWIAAHQTLSALARERAQLDGREAGWLLRARRVGVHRHLGYGSFAEYVERLFGYGPRVTEDRLRTAEALESLPQLSGALSEGRRCWSAVRELARVATPQTEAEWLEAALGKTARQIERLVSDRDRGDRPGDPERPALRRHVLRFEVAAETLATFREALGELRRRGGERLDDDAALLALARTVLGGPGDPGRASYQIAASVCECCGRAAQQAAGQLLELDPAVSDMMACDAQHVGSVGENAAARDGENAEPGGADPVTHVGGPSAPPARAAATHVGGPSGPPPPQAPRRKAERATQTIPPAGRRRVLARDAGRCVVPGCRHATFVDVHHFRAPKAGATRRKTSSPCVDYAACGIRRIMPRTVLCRIWRSERVDRRKIAKWRRDQRGPCAA
jgi:hypothetical protein